MSVDTLHSSLLRDWQGSQCITPFTIAYCAELIRADAVVQFIVYAPTVAQSRGGVGPWCA
jgi:hypothetical protein